MTKYFQRVRVNVLFLLIVAVTIRPLVGHAGSLYLPIQLAPEIEARIERLFVIARVPIIKRPIPVKHVHLALERAAEKDPVLVETIRLYLKRFENRAGLTHVSLSTAASNGVAQIMPNTRGIDTESRYIASATAHWAVNDFLALNAGGVIGERADGSKDEVAEGTFISLGWDWLQADIGYRSHWWGPFQESDMLLSTQAPAMLGVTLSNIRPIKLFHLNMSYEIFLAQMSESDQILSQDRSIHLTGNPRLFGVHISFNPVEGFAIGFNRLFQHGGADRDNSLRDLYDAFFNTRGSENIGVDGEDFGNQASSITTRYTLGDTFPFAVYMEYAGEDTSLTSDVHIGNTSLMFGIHLPKLTDQLDLSWETAEWQNAWYASSIYGSDGLRHQNSILGHWGAAQRTTGDAVGASAQSLKLIWDWHAGKSITMKTRHIANKSYSTIQYETGEEISIEYAQASGNFISGLTLIHGENVFGEQYSQLSGFLRW